MEQVLTLYNVAQLGLGALIVVMAAERLRLVLYGAPIATEPYLEELAMRIRHGDRSGARSLATDGGERWVARLASAVLHALHEGTDPWRARDAVWSELRDEGGRRLHAIRGMGSVASAVGLLGVVIEFRRAYAGAGGALMQTNLQAQALQHAVVTMAIGLMTTFVGYSALRMIRQHLKMLARDLNRTSNTLEAELGRSMASEHVG